MSISIGYPKIHTHFHLYLQKHSILILDLPSHPSDSLMSIDVNRKRFSDTSSVLLLRGPDSWFHSSIPDCLHESLLFSQNTKDMTRPASLTLAVPKSTSPVSSTITTPTDAGSSSPSPRGNKQVLDRGVEATALQHVADSELPSSPDFTSLPPFPSSPKDMPKHAREPSKGFFSNLKASKSSNKVHHMEPTIRHVSEDSPRSHHSNAETSGSPIYSVQGKTPGSTPDLSLSASADENSVEERGGMYL